MGPSQTPASAEPGHKAGWWSALQTDYAAYSSHAHPPWLINIKISQAPVIH